MHSIERIEIFSLWRGFADPPAHAARLVLTRRGEQFVREWFPEQITDEVPGALAAGLAEALARPVVPQLDPALFELPEPVLREHYDSMWTDDCPGHVVEIRFSGGQEVIIRTESQHAFMLPLKVTGLRDASERGSPLTPGPSPAAGVNCVRDSGDATPSPRPSPSRRGGTVTTVETTFDPRLSRAIAALMPKSYLEKERLAGISGMLEYDLERREDDEEPIAIAPSPPAPLPRRGEAREVCEVGPDGDQETLRPHPDPLPGGEGEDVMQEIYRVLSGVESPEEIAAAERAGKISERLLKRISAEVAQDLLARGADANISDSVGQTALMNAAFPPFNRELFRLLLQSGASLEARRRDGFTGLHLACAGGEAEAAAEWVQAGADVSARLPDGTTPLMLGAVWPKIVGTLLAAGAQVNAADDEGHTALVYAITSQPSWDGERVLSAVRELLAAGADVNQPDRDGVTPQEHARRALARVKLEEEVFRKFHPEREASGGRMPDAVRLAEAVVGLVAGRGR